jgi:hypothetical protein
MSGAPNTSSSSRMTCGGIELEDERMKRSGWRRMMSAFFGARPTMAWCMVGTAVYQVGGPRPSRRRTSAR